MRHLLFAAALLSGLGACADPRRGQAMLTGPHFNGAYHVEVTSERVRLACDDALADGRLRCDYVEHIALLNHGPTAVDERFAVYTRAGEAPPEVRINGAPAHVTLADGPIDDVVRAGVDFERDASGGGFIVRVAPEDNALVRSGAIDSERSWLEEVLDFAPPDTLRRHVYRLTLEPRERASLEIRGALILDRRPEVLMRFDNPVVFRHPFGAELWGLACRYEEAGCAYRLRYIPTAHRVDEEVPAEVELRWPPSWTSAAAEPFSYRLRGEPWRRWEGGRYGVASKTSLPPETLFEVAAVSAPPVQVFPGAPDVALGAGLESGNPEAFLARAGYEAGVALTGGMALYFGADLEVSTARADSAGEPVVVVTPAWVSFATPGFLIPMMPPSLDLRLGLPVQVSPEARVGVRLQAGLQVVGGVAVDVGADFFPGALDPTRFNVLLRWGL